MREQPNRWIWTGAGAAALAAAGVSGAILQRRHGKRIESDPENDALRDPLSGSPLAIRSADGTMLHAEVFGPEDGTTLVLAHGWTETLDFWTYVIRDVTAKGLRVVAYDLRGHGDSDPAIEGDYAIERFGEDLEAVLTAGVPEGRRVAVAGHSLGAMSIAAWAERHDVAQRVFAVAMINTGVGDLIAESLLFPAPGFAKALNKALAVHGFLGARAPLPRTSTPASHAAIRYIAFGPEATPAQIAFYERMLVATPPDARASIGIAMSALELHHALERITVPTLVIGSENDRLTPPSHARKIADMLPNLDRLIVLPDTGHMAPLERPAEVSRAIAKLVARSADADADVAEPVADSAGDAGALAGD
ncbi:MAG TPA: alpha/beta fold hydrolase [Solirubrobacteraceae bacterium]|jgi:pimeloyl-ACP methyl ester carboxylesterase|nr:alpha/beta fold hydrolase [Solirubrobacteraceae bacterium]